MSTQVGSVQLSKVDAGFVEREFVNANEYPKEDGGKVPPPTDIPKAHRGRWGYFPDTKRIVAVTIDGVVKIRTGKEPSNSDKAFLDGACPLRQTLDGRAYRSVNMGAQPQVMHRLVNPMAAICC